MTVQHAVLLRYIVDVRKAASEGHRRVVDCRHLGGQPSLDLVAWLDSLTMASMKLPAFILELDLSPVRQELGTPASPCLLPERPPWWRRPDVPARFC
jgi:hypothetical protein